MEPRTLFLLQTDDGDKPSPALTDLMTAMGLPEATTFTDAAAAIHTAEWHLMPGKPEDVRAALQAQAGYLTPCLKRLGILAKDGGHYATYRKVTHAIWPGASLIQCKARLIAGINYLMNGCMPQMANLDAIAAVTRKPTRGETDDISLSGLPYDKIVTADGLVCEGELMRHLWDAEVRREPHLGSLTFDVITTDRVPPEALHGRATTASTVEDWWIVRSTPPAVPPAYAAVFSIVPYALRCWMQAIKTAPSVRWCMLAECPTSWSVPGAISEIGKIVHGIANGTL